MTTPRIEEMVQEYREKIKLEAFYKTETGHALDLTKTRELLLEALTQAHQAGTDEAVETERNRLKEWVQAQVNDGSGQCIHYEEILVALQDNK